MLDGHDPHALDLTMGVGGFKPATVAAVTTYSDYTVVCVCVCVCATPQKGVTVHDSSCQTRHDHTDDFRHIGGCLTYLCTTLDDNCTYGHTRCERQFIGCHACLLSDTVLAYYCCLTPFVDEYPVSHNIIRPRQRFVSDVHHKLNS